LDCGSPLPLFKRKTIAESGRRLPQSRTLARHPVPLGIKESRNQKHIFLRLH